MTHSARSRGAENPLERAARAIEQSLLNISLSKKIQQETREILEHASKRKLQYAYLSCRITDPKALHNLPEQKSDIVTSNSYEALYYQLEPTLLTILAVMKVEGACQVLPRIRCSKAVELENVDWNEVFRGLAKDGKFGPIGAVGLEQGKGDGPSQSDKAFLASLYGADSYESALLEDCRRSWFQGYGIDYS